MDKVIVNYTIVNGRTIKIDDEVWNVTETEKNWKVSKKDGILTIHLDISRKDCKKFEDLEKFIKENYKGNLA